MTETKTGEAQAQEKPPEEKQEAKEEVREESGPKKSGKKDYTGSKNPLTIFYHWCKACNICIALCPHEVFIPDRDGKPIVEHPEKCTQCAICWLHCPDLAIVSNEK
ncbi:MAG: 4Fe-4S ferredoxin [candidate division Zixibacteria bacterium]|nr:4Fe-4S ferredoxin [candidate division Zixibacteria bacterium]